MRDRTWKSKYLVGDWSTRSSHWHLQIKWQLCFWTISMIGEKKPRRWVVEWTARYDPCTERWRGDSCSITDTVRNEWKLSRHECRNTVAEGSCYSIPCDASKDIARRIIPVSSVIVCFRTRQRASSLVESWSTHEKYMASSWVGVQGCRIWCSCCLRHWQ